MSKFEFQTNGLDLAMFLAEELKAEKFLSEDLFEKGGSERVILVNSIILNDVLQGLVEKYFAQCKMKVSFHPNLPYLDGEVLKGTQCILMVAVSNYSDTSHRRIKVKTVVIRQI